MDPTVSHLHLLEAARTLERAASTGDVSALHRELCSLRNDLTAHLGDEAEPPEPLPPVPNRLMIDGQLRIRVLVDDLLADTTTGPQGECACLSRSAEIVRSLARQARLERNLLARRVMR